MPDPPDGSFFVRHVLERPWLAALLLVGLGAIVLWRALAGEQRRAQIVAASMIVAGIAVFVIGTLVTTPGEHAEAVVKRFVAAVEAGDAQAALAEVAPVALLSFDRPENPAMPRSAIERGIDEVVSRHQIESNRITHLRGYTVDGRTGVVHLACWTQTASSMGNVPSQWVVRVVRQAGDAGTGDDAWRIERITCISIAGRSPSRSIFGL